LGELTALTVVSDLNKFNLLNALPRHRPMYLRGPTFKGREGVEGRGEEGKG